MVSKDSAAALKEKQLLEKFEKDKLLREGNSKYAEVEKYFGKIAFIPTYDIEIEDNCRSLVDTKNTQFEQLKLSIKEKGILQNLVLEVRKSTDGQIKLACISGQRRLLIAKELGIEKVPCLITVHNTKHQTLSKSLDENLLRENLFPIDIAESYYMLFTDGWTLDTIAKRYEKDSRTIQYFINVAKFSTNIKNLIKNHKEIFTTRALLNNFGKKSWKSDAELMKAINNFIQNSQSNTQKIQNGFVSIKSDYERKTGLKIKMKKNKEKKSVTLSFNYNSEVELTSLLNKL